ncbi:MAG: response regulator transcription factor [Oscillospiraceae bacterium]|nr:response regulator transcription factor [Oscillospiraceae bacterium]
MKVVICDDDYYSMEQLREQVSSYMTQRAIRCDFTCSTSSSEIMQSKDRFDMAFLDIQMGEVDGISLAKELRARNSRTALFFITNFEGYQDAAMDLQAFRFLSKPFDPERLFAGLDKAMEYIDGAYVDIVLCCDGDYKRFPVDDILYVMRDNRKVTLITKDEEADVKDSFGDICNRLPTSFFSLIHNSFFANLHHVKKYTYSELNMDNGDKIPIASHRQADFRKFWFGYLRRR